MIKLAKNVKEENIERLLCEKVKAAGGIAEKVTVLGRRGFFDRIVILPNGRIVWVELKRPQGGRLSPHQIMRHAAYLALGADVQIIRNEYDVDRLMTGA